MSLPEALYFDGEKLIEVGDVATVADLLPVEGVIVKNGFSSPARDCFEPSALQAANDAAGGDAEEEAPGTEGGEETGETALARPLPTAAKKKSKPLSCYSYTRTLILSFYREDQFILLESRRNGVPTVLRKYLSSFRSSAWLPSSTMVPSSSTRIRSIFWMVLRR